MRVIHVELNRVEKILNTTAVTAEELALVS